MSKATGVLDQVAICVICAGWIIPGDETRTNARNGVMHAECDPEPTRCPHCNEVISE